MKKATSILKNSYIWFILSIFYIPIIFMTIFSFNQNSAKGRISWNVWNGFSWNSWRQLGDKSIGFAFANTLIIGITVAFFSTAIALITVYGLWRQKKIVKSIVSTTSNIPLINPDVVTAIILSITLSALFGALSISQEGLIRVIISHIVMTLPYAILLLYPRSEKFNRSLLEASQDLGVDKIKSWFKVYIPFMFPMILVSLLATLTLSFDDFIITRLVSNTSTLGSMLYQGEFKGWGLALGAILLIIVLTGATISIFIVHRRDKVRKSRKHV